MSTESLPTDHVTCYECGQPTPISDGPVCWACQKKKSEISADAMWRQREGSIEPTSEQQILLLQLARQQAADIARIRRYVFFMAFVVFVGLVSGFIGVLLVGNSTQ